MRSHIGNILICDHTFKLGSHIGERSSRKEPTEGQFDRAFIGLNEHGEVMFLRLTRDAGFEQIEDLLQDFKLRLLSEGIIGTDNFKTQTFITQTCCRLSILQICCNLSTSCLLKSGLLSFANLLQLVGTTCSKPVDNKF